MEFQYSEGLGNYLSSERDSRRTSGQSRKILLGPRTVKETRSGEAEVQRLQAAWVQSSALLFGGCISQDDGCSCSSYFLTAVTWQTPNKKQLKAGKLYRASRFKGALTPVMVEEHGVWGGEVTGVLVTAVRKQREMKADTLVAFSLVKPPWKLPYTHLHACPECSGWF